LTALDESFSVFPSGPNRFSRTSRGSGRRFDCLSPEPFGLREEANKDVVDSLEARERDEERGLKPGLWGAEEGARWLGLRGAEDLVAGGGEDAEGAECKRSSHISSLSMETRVQTLSAEWGVIAEPHTKTIGDRGLSSAGSSESKRNESSVEELL
jgi:hypothetical protein